MDKEALALEIKALVASIFSEKEEAEMRKQTEDALQTSASTIEDLTSSLELKNTEVAELTSTVTSLQESTSELTAQLEAAAEAKAQVETELAQALATIDGIAKDKLADERMSSLEQAGVARKDADAQRTKVREMSSEDFEAYKSELESVKATILASIEADKVEADKVAAEVAAQELAAAEAAKAAPGAANVDPKAAASAALNLELASSDVADKYKALGEAMAASFKKN